MLLQNVGRGDASLFHVPSVHRSTEYVLHTLVPLNQFLSGILEAVWFPEEERR